MCSVKVANNMEVIRLPFPFVPFSHYILCRKKRETMGKPKPEQLKHISSYTIWQRTGVLSRFLWQFIYNEMK